MTKIFHNIRICVFAKEEENKQDIYNSLLNLLPFNAEQEKIIIHQKTATGFNERKIIIYEIMLEKDRHINLFLQYLLKRIDEYEKRKIFRQIETRLDAELHFYLRFEKEKLIKQGILTLTDEGNCYHIKMSIATYPKNRETALPKVKQLFKNNNTQ